MSLASEDGDPEDGDKVEILVDGKWIPATFSGSNYYFNGEEEVWWFEHFATDDGKLYPEDPQSRSGDELPEWRRAR